MIEEVAEAITAQESPVKEEPEAVVKETIVTEKATDAETAPKN